MILQKNFHPMRGDVYDGSKVQMENGDILEIRRCMDGWGIYKDDKFLAGPFAAAFEVDAFIVYYC